MWRFDSTHRAEELLQFTGGPQFLLPDSGRSLEGLPGQLHLLHVGGDHLEGVRWQVGKRGLGGGGQRAEEGGKR